MTMGALNEDSLVIEAYIDANVGAGLSSLLTRCTPRPAHPVKNMLIFTTFRPATSMGVPRPGTVVLSFSKVSVKG
jgi:hypothetical protein